VESFEAEKLFFAALAERPKEAPGGGCKKSVSGENLQRIAGNWPQIIKMALL